VDYSWKYMWRPIRHSAHSNGTQRVSATYGRAPHSALRSRTALSVVLTPVSPQRTSPSQAIILLIRFIAEARSAGPFCNDHSQASPL
jgi:hypothetical protein